MTWQARPQGRNKRSAGLTRPMWPSAGEYNAMLRTMAIHESALCEGEEGKRGGGGFRLQGVKDAV